MKVKARKQMEGFAFDSFEGLPEPEGLRCTLLFQSHIKVMRPCF